MEKLPISASRFLTRLTFESIVRFDAHFDESEFSVVPSVFAELLVQVPAIVLAVFGDEIIEAAADAGLALDGNNVINLWPGDHNNFQSDFFGEAEFLLTAGPPLAMLASLAVMGGPFFVFRKLSK